MRHLAPRIAQENPRARGGTRAGQGLAEAERGVGHVVRIDSAWHGPWRYVAVDQRRRQRHRLLPTWVPPSPSLLSLTLGRIRDLVVTVVSMFASEAVVAIVPYFVDTAQHLAAAGLGCVCFRVVVDDVHTARLYEGGRTAWVGEQVDGDARDGDGTVQVLVQVLALPLVLALVLELIGSPSAHRPPRAGRG